MHFDVFYELAVPGFTTRTEPEVVHSMLNELSVAELSGFRTAWLVEHHFMREYSHSSAPDLVLAAASQRTERLRLGHAIVPLPYHHPVHVAERIATLDILSHGRLEFGFGRGFSPSEYEAFGVGMEDSRGLVEESLAIIRQSFLRAPVQFHGHHFHLSDVDIVPGVVQHPHPPLWMAAVSPESFVLAAKLGVGVLVGPFKPWFMTARDLEDYRAAWRAQHGSLAGSRVAMTLGVFCLEDGERARAIARTNITWFYRKLIAQTAPVLAKLHAGYEYYRRLGSVRLLLEKTINLPSLEALGMVVAGDPEHCCRKLKRYADAGVDHLLCAVGAGGSPAAVVTESLRTIGRHVIPRFAT